MSSFCRSYGTKDKLAEAYHSYAPKNKRDKLNNMDRNSDKNAVIDKYASDKDEDGVDEPEIVSVSTDNADEDGGERQDTPPAESNNASILQ